MEQLDHPDAGCLLLVHVNDAPATIPCEALTDGERVLPGEGSFPLARILSDLEAPGYRGGYSLELFAEALRAEEPFAVAARAHRSLVWLLGPNSS